MIESKKVLGIVLARAGSKGLPGKNYELLVGKPLVQYAIEAGKTSRYVDDVMISSDCKKCIEIASDLGVNVPFTRPDYLSGDTVPSADVIEHAINYLHNQGDSYDIFVLLEPTSPLRDGEDIDAAIEAMIFAGNTSLVSVCQAEDQHPCFMFKMEDKGNIVPWSGGKFEPLRRQDIQKAYYLDGSVYISYIDTFFQLRTFCHENTGAYVVPKWKAFEIDDIWDFLCIEAIIKFRESNSEV